MSLLDQLRKITVVVADTGDIDAIKAGLADGTIDAIATDHAPHAAHTKEVPLDQAPPGMVGLETALALAITELDMPLADIVAALSWQPAAIAGVADRHGRPIEVGEPANLTVFHPTQQWTVVPAQLASKSRNTPYAGRTVQGKVRHTIFEGNPVVIEPGMVFFLHMIVLDSDSGTAMAPGHSVRVTAKGYERLSRSKLDLVVV